jgi:hypothetical protein
VRWRRRGAGRRRAPLGRSAHIRTGSPGVGPGDMDVVEVLTDAELELVLAGRAVPGRGDLDGLASALAELRERTAAEPVPELGVDLRITLAEAEVRAQRAPVERPAVVPAPRPGRSARRRSLAGAAAVTVALGLGATHSALPSALQEIAASAAKQLGVGLPDPAEGGSAAVLGQPGADPVEQRRSGGRRGQPSPFGPAGAAGAAAPAAPGEQIDDADGVRLGRATVVVDAPAPPDPPTVDPGPPGSDPQPAPRSQPQTAVEDPVPAPPRPTEADDTAAETVEEAPATEPHPSDRRPEHAPGPSSPGPGASAGSGDPGSQDDPQSTDSGSSSPGSDHQQPARPRS